MLGHHGLNLFSYIWLGSFDVYPHASEASREVANLTEEKIYIHLCIASKNLSVCLLPNLTPIISGLAKQNGLKFF